MRHNTRENEITHTPVMWREVLEYAGQTIGVGSNVFIDCTLGEGGHSELLLRTFDNIKIIGFERDSEILDIAKKRLSDYKEKIEFINDNFSSLSGHLGVIAGKISGFLYDFGISSYHFDKSRRGFSLMNDEPLDMRLDKDSRFSAYNVVNEYSEDKLNEIFRDYGEEHWSKRIARKICEKRKEKSIETTVELADLVLNAIPGRFRVKNIHPATRVFQAIRIEVNNELTVIRKSLNEAYKFLASGGIITAISFHSLEDRIVKDQFRRLAKGCTCSLPPEQCRCSGRPIVTLLTKKPLSPKEDELKENRRARSAKLRACRKI